LKDNAAKTNHKRQTMGLRYRQSVRVLPGVRLNFTANGLSSVSIGVPGCSVNLNTKRTRTTVGLPGSGLSYSTDQAPESGFGFVVGVLVWLAVLALVAVAVLVVAAVAVQ
jgi:hypothetical protein